MRDIVITAKVVRRELLIVLACFLAAEGINIHSIIKYHTSFLEIFSQIGYVLLMMLLIWLVITVIRLMVYLIGKLLRG